MYTGYFGLKEIPFSIAPNPHYLFMSVRHREALAHLTYGLGETGGFVLLTGEVGTGKTTVSRCLLDQLPENTQAAFILNPTLSSQELLATICDELKIRYRKTGATLKTLTDKIQEKLLKNHQAGLNTILIIDEAQHLQAEVLEQLRLLTNLETHTKKLLQVILIGQPELQQLLQRRDLRQLAQRITARYHLLPLNREEVAQYIQHRLAIADCQQPLFNRRAITTIHQLSKGIPRLINLLCDRALLGAYGENKQIVDKKLVLGASVEALGAEFSRQPWWQKTSGRLALAGGLLAVTLGLGFVAGNYQDQAPGAEPVTPLSAVNAGEAADISQQPASAKELSPETDWPSVTAASRSLPEAVRHLFSLWRLQVEEDLTEPCQVANSYELSCYWFKGTLPALLKLNYPAVFKFIDDSGSAFYGTLLGVSQSANGEKESYRFQFDRQEHRVDKAWFDSYWQGGAVVFWQPPKNAYFEPVTRIDEHSLSESVQWLENKLSQQQQRPAREVQGMDAMLKNQLRQFQRQHGIDSSGDAGEQTLMLLTNTVDQGQPIFK
ncbi:AAA family ATPase [Thalassomonas viridans]|uniref:AAA family ATPase n=1 Tax=Thalassomonas viridans TaxID=137584 RepID=A0AAF0C6D5_9GAMM|nr:ExeA family protein [Thalassomonas viridans]WDE04242.1 AAA family ATPase [Thalassomonas viridans]